MKRDEDFLRRKRQRLRKSKSSLEESPKGDSSEMIQALFVPQAAFAVCRGHRFGSKLTNSLLQ
jgi:hypothetical protein